MMSLSRDLLLLSRDTRTLGRVEPFLQERGYGLYSVSAQDEALRKLRTKSILGFVCDLEVVVDEVKLSEVIKVLLSPERGRFAVILIASDLSEETRRKFKNIPGVKALLSKPVDLNQLGRVLRDVAPLRDAAEGATILFDDDDREKPLNDPRDRVSIEIGLFLRPARSGDDAEGKYSVIEYGGGTLLFDGGQSAFAEGDEVSGRLVVSGPEGVEEHRFESRIVGFETSVDGAQLVSCDSSRIPAQALEKLDRMLGERQKASAAFLASMQE